MKINTECEFCESESIKKRELSSNSFSRAFLTRTPITKGHTLVIPKECKTRMSELTIQEKDSLLELVSKVQQKLTKALGVTAFNLAWNEGEEAGQTVPHLHIHIVPRRVGDKGVYHYEPREFLYRPGKRATLQEDELEKIAFHIKNS